MQKVRKAEGLAGAAGYLCSAYEELRAAGYQTWSDELRMLMEIIDAEIDWFRDNDKTIRVSKS